MFNIKIFNDLFSQIKYFINYQHVILFSYYSSEQCYCKYIHINYYFFNVILENRRATRKSYAVDAFTTRNIYVHNLIIMVT